MVYCKGYIITGIYLIYNSEGYAFLPTSGVQTHQVSAPRVLVPHTMTQNTRTQWATKCRHLSPLVKHPQTRVNDHRR